MKTLFLLPLLITGVLNGADKYSLVVDGVDDVLECSLNGESVAHFTFGQSGTVPLSPKEGQNVLICTPKDMGRLANHACWAFKYRLFRNWDEMAKVYSSCCAPGCPDQPGPIRTDFSAK